MPDWYPFVILACGVLVVMGLIIGLRLNAFLALITAAIVVSLMAPGPLGEKIGRVAIAFGTTAAGIGIVIALASVVGKCLMESGGADRIVCAFLGWLGERRAAAALAGSGFVLSIPVFFDTVFYLLVPLARSMHRRTRTHFLKYVLAICAGAAATHTLVPPTPGPLLVCEQLGINVGTMMTVGILCGIPAVAAGLLFAGWIDRRLQVQVRTDEPAAVGTGAPAQGLPGLPAALMVILLPVLLITSNTVAGSLARREGAGSAIRSLADWTALAGNPNFAMLVSAALAIALYVRHCRPGTEKLARVLEESLMSGGLIILITAGGGAFGAMLKLAGIGQAIEAMFHTGATTGGSTLLLLGFAMAALIKMAQGSSTVAMITVSGMMAALVQGIALPYNPVYLGVAIGTGSLVGSWMNDSGFWIFSRMGGFSAAQALKSWTPLLSIVGCTAFATCLLLSALLPMAR